MPSVGVWPTPYRSIFTAAASASMLGDAVPLDAIPVDMFVYILEQQYGESQADAAHISSVKLGLQEPTSSSVHPLIALSGKYMFHTPNTAT